MGFFSKHVDSSNSPEISKKDTIAQTTAIKIEKLTIKYGDFLAVNDVSLFVKRGEIFGFLGPNGSGKTTIIKTLCGLIKPTSGKASVIGLDITKQVRQIKEHIGYMSQKFSLYEDLTVIENINFYGTLYGLSSSYLKQRKEVVISLTNINNYLDRPAGKLSGGWKQRLALACAILHNPEVVFLDEPTAGIDPVARRELWDLLFKLSGQGVTFFVTTHYMDEAERCSRIGYIYLSKLIAFGTLDELRNLPAVSPPQTTRVNVLCQSSSLALTFIKNLPYVLEATIFGQSIHALIRSMNVKELEKDLSKLGFGKVTVETIIPSLEDVFVTLTNNIKNENNANK